MEDGELIGWVKVMRHKQVTLIDEVARELDIKPGDSIGYFHHKDGIMIKRVKVIPDDKD